MGDYTYSQEAIDAWRRLLKAKLEMWDAAYELEEALGSDCDTGSDSLDRIAADYQSPEEAWSSGANDLQQFLDGCFNYRRAIDAKV